MQASERTGDGKHSSSWPIPRLFAVPVSTTVVAVPVLTPPRPLPAEMTDDRSEPGTFSPEDGNQLALVSQDAERRQKPHIKDFDASRTRGLQTAKVMSA